MKQRIKCCTGPAKKSRVISEKERSIVAFHEAGHTVIGVVLDEADVVHKVTIVLVVKLVDMQ